MAETKKEHMGEYTQNSLRKLYEEMLKVRESVKPEVLISLYPIGKVETDLCFVVDIDKQRSILVYSKQVRNILPFLLQTYGKSSFKYIIQQNSDDEYNIIKPSTQNESSDAFLSEDDGDKIQTRDYLYVLDILRFECLPIDVKIKQTLFDVTETQNADVSEICEFLKRVANRVGKDKEYLFSQGDGIFSFKDIDEDRLFQLFFLGRTQPRKVCRYCSLESLYQMLSNQTIRLYGLHGMNDNSEFQHAHKSFLGSEVTDNDIEQMNHIYIMSGSEISKRDDLEMWRLYGDDGKGVCLEFDKKSVQPPFVFAKVIYEFNRTEKENRKMDARWKLLAHLIAKLRNLDMKFQFQNKEKWMSFFKSGDYCYEKEVRLLYLEPNNDHSSHDWVLSGGNYIINPFVQFGLSSKQEATVADVIPLKLNKIILGPKCPEKALNAKQIWSLLQRDPKLRGLNISVEESKINNYR